MSDQASIARTDATGQAMLPDLVRWSSSFAADLAFAREDLLGSAAHVTMLGSSGLVPTDAAEKIRAALLALFDDAEKGVLALPPNEEDVHMAVEANLTQKLGPMAGHLHTARSRNDQVALDLRLFVRREASHAIAQALGLSKSILDRAEHEKDALLPAYTHRQRAQPISAAFLLSAWVTDLLRAVECLILALDRANVLPLGSGACSGTSLPIDRDLVRRLLAFPRITLNALDAVGDRGFILDWTWGAARVELALAKLSADVVDFATREFGLVTMDGAIAAGSSMMPQKKNPDMFELVRGQSSRGIGAVVQMLTLVKGLPSGYNRDQQEDRAALVQTGSILFGALQTVATCLPHVHFDRANGARALAEGFTQSTDLAEGLVRRGVPFRDAYRAVGALVRLALNKGIPLSQITEVEAKGIHPLLDAEALKLLEPAHAVAAKEVPGGTGPNAVSAQIASLRQHINHLERSIPHGIALREIAERIAQEPIARG